MSLRGIGKARIGLLFGISMSLALVSIPVAQAKDGGPTGCSPLSHRVFESSTTCLTSDQVTETSDTVTINSYTDPSISNPTSITTGSDGALWFPDGGSGGIGRITTNGVVSSYGGAGIGESYGIASGSDGALWFTLIQSDSIGRITTDGNVSDYSDPNGDQPYAITAGPDGALWFTSDLNTIGRVTTEGAFSSYGNFQDGVFDPQSITTGPDGALWFGNQGNSSIGGSQPPALSPTTPIRPSTRPMGSQLDPTVLCGSPTRATTR